MKDLGSRLVSTSISLTILITLLAFSLHPWIRYVVAVCVSFLAIVAIWEYQQLAKIKGGQVAFYPLVPLAALIVFSFFAEAQRDTSDHFSIIAIFFSIGVLFFLHFKEKEGAVIDLAVSTFSLVYLAIPLGMMLSILYMPEGQDGRWWLVYLLSVTKITDIGAYFVGSLWGKKKLAPQISPGKTVEGALFGWGCSILTSVGFHLLSTYFSEDRFHLSLSTSLWLGALLGIASQFGDLSESLLKRDAEKKDSNKLPGIGGVLDMIDSLLFNAPILYIYLL